MEIGASCTFSLLLIIVVVITITTFQFEIKSFSLYSSFIRSLSSQTGLLRYRKRYRMKPIRERWKEGERYVRIYF